MGIFFTADTKPDTVIFQSEVVKFDLFKSDSFVRTAFENKQIPKEAFRLYLHKGLRLLQMQKISRWLIDLSTLKTATTDELEWMQKDWFPRLLQTEITHIALIPPKDAGLGNVLLKAFKQVPQVKCDSFKNIEEAVDWLNYDAN